MSELIHTEERGGFTISTYAEIEYSSPYELFDDDDVQDVIDGVNSGALVWFMAHVQVTRYGIALSDEYLGGCCYKSYSDFISDGYYSDMVEQAINEAKAKIAELMKEFS